MKTRLLKLDLKATKNSQKHIFFCHLMSFFDKISSFFIQKCYTLGGHYLIISKAERSILCITFERGNVQQRCSFLLFI